MSKHRHKKASGGRAHMKVSGNPDVFEEAEDKHGTRKRGGAVGADKSPLSSAHKASDDGNSTPGSADTYGGTPTPKKPAQDAHTRGRP